MMISYSFLLVLNLFFVVLFSSSIISTTRALVPPSKTFKYVNYGGLDYDHIEYNADCLALDLSNDHFTVNFCSTTNDEPRAYTLIIAMGDSRWPKRWVWAANWGTPVHDNATLTFGSDGNLVLADHDGQIAWQTQTANKGVVDLNLLPNGNLVLLNKQGKFVWQSFDFPTDTLLVGQGLASNQKLVSRLSEFDDSEGPYSMVLEPKRLGFYYRSKSSSKPLLYYEHSLDFDLSDTVPVKNITFKVSPDSVESGFSNVLRFELYTSIWRESSLTQPNYNSTLSYLRLRWDGNLVIYTYYGGNLAASLFSPWQQTYTALPLDSFRTLCQLPEKCGQMGICEDNQCVACPTPGGLMGWSKQCKPPKLPSCKTNGGNLKESNGSASVSYYKVVGVDHFMSLYEEGEGPMKITECKRKCNEDCKCVAFFYRKDTSKCLITTQLNTMPKIYDSESRSSHLAFIKYLPTKNQLGTA